MTEQQNAAPIRQADPNDVAKNKTVAIFAYLIFFLPLVTSAKDSPFAKFHANQGLVLLLFNIVGQVIGGVIPIIGWFLVLPLVWLASIVFLIMGMVNASNGRMKELPVIGQLHLLDK